MKSFTLDQWCAQRAVSRAMFYKLKKQGRAPSTYHVGRSVYITADADAAWLAARVAAVGLEAA